MDAAFGALPGDQVWAVRDGGVGFHLNPAALQARQVSAARAGAELKATLLKDARFASVYTREQLTGPEPLDELGEMMRRSYFPARSPDVMFILRPNFIMRQVGAAHGTPYDYDTHVPLVWFGAGIKPGVHEESVHVEDLAPTLAGLLGVDLPPEAKGKRLF
jgi:hypothetical protein